MKPPPSAWDPHAVQDTLRMALPDALRLRKRGRVQEAVGTVLRVSGLDMRVGDLARLHLGVEGATAASEDDADGLLAEVVGLTAQGSLLMPFGPLDGIGPQTSVEPLPRGHGIPVGDGLLGRVLDGFGRPIDGAGRVAAAGWQPVKARPPAPLSRLPVDTVMPTGVRAIDALLALGQGQRMGLFAPAGVGKSTLLGMLARGVDCDVAVIALIGERGREVNEFLQEALDARSRARSVVVVATSDAPAMERAKAAHVATAAAEYFRDEQGLRVLLLMDSVTRFARALREIGLASGEPPTRRGFPPSTFSELPRLLERTGCGARGSITAVYTVLMEDDESADPVAEEVRSILDGHIVLSRELAAAGHYPAIDCGASLSRVMDRIVEPAQRQARFKEIELLVKVGEYQPGHDAEADEAQQKIGRIQAFLQQSAGERIDHLDAVAALDALVANPAAAAPAR
jgi:ATP synthase in type III secretion protein N